MEISSQNQIKVEYIRLVKDADKPSLLSKQYSIFRPPNVLLIEGNFRLPSVGPTGFFVPVRHVGMGYPSTCAYKTRQIEFIPTLALMSSSPS